MALVLLLYSSLERVPFRKYIWQCQEQSMSDQRVQPADLLKRIQQLHFSALPCLRLRMEFHECNRWYNLQTVRSLAMQIKELFQYYFSSNTHFLDTPPSPSFRPSPSFPSS